jgi:hypothetical protein
VRVRFHRVSDDRHQLEVIREDGSRDQVSCETRSYLEHDLLHFAVEAEAGLRDGFWGNLARGKTLEQMNDRTGASMAGEVPQLMQIEQVVGAMSRLRDGEPPAALARGFVSYCEQIGATVPSWFDEALVEAAARRMRALQGHWRATPHGETMELRWPVPAD